MKFIVMYLILILFSIGEILGQNPKEQTLNENVLWITLNDSNLKPTKNNKSNIKSNNGKLNKIFENNKVVHYSQALPFAKTPALLKIYQIDCKGNASKLKGILKKEFANEIKGVRQFYNPIATYDPTDYMWYLTTQDTTGWLWHLHKIKANLAWDITHGDPNVNIAIIDTWFDVNHPDLSQKINPHYDPYTSTSFTSDCKQDNHGTTVASFAAAETDGGGQLASVGFNTNLLCFTWGNGVAKALYASNVMHADVVSISWYSSCNRQTGNDEGQDSLIIKEILDNGTIIVASAGNGSENCNGGVIYPFSANYDQRIIKVTSTDINDNHTYFKDGVNKTHSHYPNVDICAPGYCVMGAKCTENEVNGNCEENTWPYYGCCTGTSFATPIVAGVCALMRSVNPCITPIEAQDIIKSTADPVNDANLYPGIVGAGRINAYRCVKEAATNYIQNETLSGTQTIASHIIEAGNHVTNSEPTGDVTVQNGANITFAGRYEVTLKSGFEVVSGAELTIDVDVNNTISCN